MALNAGPEYGEAQQRYENAKTPQEKLAALETMKTLSPKHKAAEKLNAELNRKIAQLRLEIEKEKTQASKRGGGPSLSVKKEGIGQLAILGLPNAGKSTFFNAMTGLQTPVADYEFTTTKPEVGMIDFKGTKIQLVDLPAIIEGSSAGKVNGKEILSVARNADALILILNVGTQEEDYRTLSTELSNAGIILNRKKPQISIVQTTFPGISITGKEFLKIPQEQFVEFLKTRGMHNAQVILRENTTLETAIEALDGTLVYKRTILIYTKGKPTRRVEAGEGAIHIAWELENPRPAEMTTRFFEILEKVFIFTKKPGQDAATTALVAPNGSTIMDIAMLVHKDIAQTLKYAKVWGGTRFDGQRVAKDYEVKNEDIVEFYW